MPQSHLVIEDSKSIKSGNKKSLKLSEHQKGGIFDHRNWPWNEI